MGELAKKSVASPLPPPQTGGQGNSGVSKQHSVSLEGDAPEGRPRKSGEYSQAGEPLNESRVVAQINRRKGRV